MIDLHLRAESEAALVAALPMLRIDDPDEGARWVLGSPTHAFDPGVAVFEGGALVPGYHANLRLLDAAPDRAAILTAAEPFVVTPTSPAQAFAGGPEDQPMPASISDRQFAHALAHALGWSDAQMDALWRSAAAL